MNSNKRRARTALFELKEAVLAVLLEARAAGEGPIQPEGIRKRLGIPKDLFSLRQTLDGNLARQPQHYWMSLRTVCAPV